ncbi:MAG: hypothetical protein ABIH83_03130 [Candidatus Micrarchaeota archaeon]
MEKQSAFKAVFALFFLFLSGALFAVEESVDLIVVVYDGEGHVVSDVQVVANYQELINETIENVYDEGFTDVGGRWETIIYFTENSTPSDYMQLEAYSPYWSSEMLRVRIPKKEPREIYANFSMPFIFDTYRVRVLNEEGTPMSGIKVRIFQPIFLEKKTSSNGIAQFRLPSRSLVNGRVEHSGFMEEFEFLPPDINETKRSFFISINYPFTTPKLVDSNKSYNWTVQMYESTGKVLSDHLFTIKAGNYTIIYRTDSIGYLRIFDVSYEQINLSWEIYNYTYTKTFNLSQNLSDKLISKQLLKIHDPSIIHLGESCYRVEVNITDPRKGVMKQVVAKAEDGNQTLALTLEQNQTFNQSHIRFYRIFCVVEDTRFDIVATSPYENATLTIQLLKSTYVKPPPGGITEEEIPEEVTKKIEEERKTEIIIILVEALVLLIVAYFLMKFRGSAFYFLQSILRFAYFTLRSFIEKKKAE